MFGLVAVSAVACLLAFIAFASSGNAQEPADKADSETAAIPPDPSPSAPQVPDGILDGGAAWLNTSTPITMKDLRGKVVLFDFWTYCCINCMHVLPDLKYLEEKYPNELVVIGVHSAKFDNEKDSEAIRNAIMRYGIVHPVVNDSEMLIWRKFGTKAWPTLALVDPQGRYLGSQSGEGNRDLFDRVIGKVVEYHRAIGTLNEDPIVFDLEAVKAQPTPLRYPGKVLADAQSGRLFISDTSHNRIVVTDMDGNTQVIIGSGRIGNKDGSFAEAEFDHPQGVCLIDSMLFVADTENHMLRKVDLKQRRVTRIAGTGVQRRGPWPGSMTGPNRWQSRPSTTALNSPWALHVHEDYLYIAMAGPHQIWRMGLDEKRVGLYAGNGREDIMDGLLLPRTPYSQGTPGNSISSFAQPSGLTSDGKWLFVADSEGSSIRAVPFDQKKKVWTVV